MYPYKEEPTQCPVCRAILGKRDKRKVFRAHCDECRATFWWKPWAHTPNVVMDNAKTFKGYCTKNGCVCHD